MIEFNDTLGLLKQFPGNIEVVGNDCRVCSTELSDRILKLFPLAEQKGIDCILQRGCCFSEEITPHILFPSPGITYEKIKNVRKVGSEGKYEDIFNAYYLPSSQMDGYLEAYEKTNRCFTKAEGYARKVSLKAEARYKGDAEINHIAIKSFLHIFQTITNNLRNKRLNYLLASGKEATFKTYPCYV